jgi:SAM-dependent methyltransferase
MTVIERSKAAAHTLSGEANGRIWGARAADWALIQEPQCAAGYHAVFDKAPVGSATRLLDAGLRRWHGPATRGGPRRRGRRHRRVGRAAGGRPSRLPGARLEQGDLEVLPFEDDSFDVVTGFNSFQFAADPVAALQEARRVTKPGGGKVFIMTWGEPGGMEVTALVAALKPLLPPMPANASGPFALSEPGKLEELAARAGLTPREVFDVDSPWTYPDLATAQKGLGSSGVAFKAAETSGQAALDAAHEAALAPFVHPMAATGSARPSASSWPENVG